MKTHVIEGVIAGNRFHAFRLGFGDGADGNRASTVFTSKDIRTDYDRGYETGSAARRRALAKYAKEVGYDIREAILREINERCEWNPTHDRPAASDDTESCKRPADLSVGSGKNNYHVCSECAKLPGFKALRLRRVRRLGRSSAL